MRGAATKAALTQQDTDKDEGEGGSRRTKRVLVLLDLHRGGSGLVPFGLDREVAGLVHLGLNESIDKHNSSQSG